MRDVIKYIEDDLDKCLDLGVVLSKEEAQRLVDGYKQKQELIERLENPWISVEVKPAKDEKLVLCSDGINRSYVGYYNHNACLWFSMESIAAKYPLSWMPIPNLNKPTKDIKEQLK